MTIETSQSKVAEWFSMGFDNPFRLYEIASLNSYDKKELTRLIDWWNSRLEIWKVAKVATLSLIKLLS